MKSIILISDGNHHEFDTIDELKEFLIPNCKSMSEDDLERCLYEGAFAFSMLNNLQIVDTHKGVYGGNYQMEQEDIDLNNSIIIDNIDTYILSLCKFNAFTLLEEINHRHYTNTISVAARKENYIVVNNFANEILMSLVGENK